MGGNVGDVLGSFRRSLGALAPDLRALRASSIYRTAPVGPPQADFLNAAVTGRTRLSPGDLLDLLQRLEAAAGRTRTGRHGPRTLDLDLLLYGDRVIRTERLVVPHPRLAQRRFVLCPLLELCPRRVVPGVRRTVATLLGLSPPGRVERLADML